MKAADARNKLYKLLTDFRNGRLDTVGFCDQFERTYNLGLDKKALTAAEAQSFGALFEKVIWYSPYSEERAQIPNYLGDDEIEKAVEVVANQLLHQHISELGTRGDSIE